jgi:hypothetical protein
VFAFPACSGGVVMPVGWGKLKRVRLVCTASAEFRTPGVVLYVHNASLAMHYIVVLALLMKHYS